MSFLKQDLILVRYLSETPGEWSKPHWCNIKQNASDQPIEISVAPINKQSDKTSFRSLTASESKKILAAQLIDGKPVFYCLIPRNNTLYRFDIDPKSKQFVAAGGRAWSLTINDYVQDARTMSLKNLFESNEIQQDKRLTMREEKGYNHAIIAEALEILLPTTTALSSSSERLISNPDQGAHEATTLLLSEDEPHSTIDYRHYFSSFFRSQRQYNASTCKTIASLLITTCGIGLASYGLGLIAGNIIILGVLICAVGILMSMIGIRQQTNNGEEIMIYQAPQGYGSGGTD